MTQDRSMRPWVTRAIRLIEADYNRSADTHLIRIPLSHYPGITLYLKDESSHPTGSLKHRLARSLFLCALCNGWIGPNTTVIEAWFGSTAVSEAYFARMLRLRFVAVGPPPPRSVSWRRSAFTAARSRPSTIRATYTPSPSASRNKPAATSSTSSPMPSARPTGAATTTSPKAYSRRWPRRTIRSRPGSYAAPAPAAAPPRSAASSAIDAMTRSFAWRTLTSLPDGCPSCIEGIGRARVEPSFVPGVIDRMTAASDPESIGAMRALARFLSRPVGGSTGTNLWACKGLVEEMAKAGTGGSVVTLLCDTGDRYADTYYDDRWLAERGIAWRDAESACAAFLGEPDSGAPGLARFVGTRRFISTTGCS